MRVLFLQVFVAAHLDSRIRAWFDTGGKRVRKSREIFTGGMPSTPAKGVVDSDHAHRFVFERATRSFCFATYCGLDAKSAPVRSTFAETHQCAAIDHVRCVG